MKHEKCRFASKASASWPAHCFHSLKGNASMCYLIKYNSIWINIKVLWCACLICGNSRGIRDDWCPFGVFLLIGMWQVPRKQPNWAHGLSQLRNRSRCGGGAWWRKWEMGSIQSDPKLKLPFSKLVKTVLLQTFMSIMEALGPKPAQQHQKKGTWRGRERERDKRKETNQPTNHLTKFPTNQPKLIKMETGNQQGPKYAILRVYLLTHIHIHMTFRKHNPELFKY